MTEDRRAVLRAVCDTIVPSLEHVPDPHGLWARKASDLSVPETLETTLATLPADQQAGLDQLLDALAIQDFLALSQRSREQIVRNMGLAGPQTAAGMGALLALTLFFHYGAPGQDGRNPNWAAFGYPGPTQQPDPSYVSSFDPIEPADGEHLELEADAVVVGSGAGGGVIAGMLAAQGQKVIVLEAGRLVDERHFDQLEIAAFQRSYWRGGPVPTGDRNVSIQAGSGFGGGTVINWTNCLRTRDWVREEWAGEHGLEGVDGPDFDRHLDTVLTRAGANSECSELNPAQERMKAGADALGWSWATVTRNWDPARHDPLEAGFMGYGDRSGAKQSTDRTWLRDAVVDHDADVLVGCFVDSVLLEDGRAAGVEARWSSEDLARSATVTVRAPTVVLAAGALETPGILLRTGIGGDAAGRNLRLHPCSAVFGRYGTDTDAWWGAPHAGLVDEFANVEDGYGFLLEGVQYTTAVTASAVPWSSGAGHKEVMDDIRRGASVIGLLREEGAGRVTLDPNGMTTPWYTLDHPGDVRRTRLSQDKMARLHAAAGAETIAGLAAGMPTWRRGDDLEAFIRLLHQVPLRAGGWRLFSAHQMGSARMGTDPSTSVAGPWGEVHDAPGVWIGDASAFPTASGTNPMITIMALAHRTAEAITGVTDHRPAAAVATA